MKIKWNWGTKLALWISAFIAFILILVYLSFGYDVGLVEKDYYPKGLAYQKRINAIENAQNKNIEFELKQDNDSIFLEIPDIKIDSGNIIFFRPSNTKLDISFPLSNKNGNIMIIPKNKLIQGKYILKIGWWSEKDEYYFEKNIFIK